MKKICSCRKGRYREGKPDVGFGSPGTTPKEKKEDCWSGEGLWRDHKKRESEEAAWRRQNRKRPLNIPTLHKLWGSRSKGK